MPDTQITNPYGAGQQVSDFTTGIDGYGNQVSYDRVVDRFRASAAVTKGDWVQLVAATTTAPLSVKQSVAADPVGLVIGVAMEAGAAGDIIQVCTRGPAICNIGDTTLAAVGDVAIKHASTAGASGSTAAGSVGATTVVGTILGVYVSLEIGTSNTAIVYVGKM